MQFLLPVILVRFLTPEAFGQYRMLWLAIMTMMMIVPLSMPQSLYFFMPRGNAVTQRIHARITLLYLAGAGLLGSLAISPWNPWLPAGMRSLAEFGLLVPAIALLFAVTSLLDILPTVEEQVSWQILIVITLSLMRTLALGAAVVLTGELRPVILLLLLLLLFKLAVLLTYMARRHGLAGRWLEPRAFVTQFRHASPLGLSSALYGLRAQADQWVAASLFALGSFAVFSIASVLGPLVNLFRQSVNHVFLPSMSKLHAGDDLTGMTALNSRANVMVASLVYPLLALVFAFAEEVVTLVYTASYVDAAPVMRVYILGLLPFVVELSSLLLLLREGGFAMRLNSGLLVFSVVASLYGGAKFGLAGAALGSTMAIYLDRWVTLSRLSRSMGIAFSHLQDWSALGLLLLLAALAGLVGRTGADLLYPSAHPALRLVFGGTLLAVCYGSLWLWRRGGTREVEP
jgi:O-antigen/teichoic acid export membrane protein